MKFSLNAIAALLKNPLTRGIAKTLIVNFLSDPKNIDMLMDLAVHYLDEQNKEAPKS